MAVFTSAKSVQYVQILLLRRKQTFEIPQGTSDFRGAGSLYALFVFVCSQYCVHGLHVFINKISGSRRWCNNSTMIYTVTIGLISVISEVGHTSDKGCRYSQMYSTAREYVRMF